MLLNAEIETTRDVGAGASSGLQIAIETFSGPLDLLLRLVLAKDLDIAAVPLASVCDQYVTHVRLMEAMDLAVASDYLVIAATLVFLKSRALLPPVPASMADQAALEASLAEEALKHELLAHQEYRIAGETLGRRLEDAAAYRVRPEAPVDDVVQRYALSANALAAAFATALQRANEQPTVLKREAFSVTVKMRMAMRLLRDGRSATLWEMIAGCAPVEIVVTFLALLELVRADKIRYTQDTPFDDITFTKTRTNDGLDSVISDTG